MMIVLSYHLMRVVSLTKFCDLISNGRCYNIAPEASCKEGIWCLTKRKNGFFVPVNTLGKKIITGFSSVEKH